MCKLNDDALQIVEQIYLIFNLHIHYQLIWYHAIGEKRDIPVVLGKYYNG